MVLHTTSTGRDSVYLTHDEVLKHTMVAGVRDAPDNFEIESNKSKDDTDDKKKKKFRPFSFSEFFKVKPTDSAPVRVIKKYLRFVGPGLMISVAYMDPGNYSTDVSAGATKQFALLFIILLSNIIAIFLQSLCIKLGSVTGLDLSRACREHLPKWLNYILWIFAECAIIATDVAEVIGTAIALNILIRIPLPAGIVLTCIDVLFVLMAYRPGSSLNFVRMFEYAVALLVFGVVICFSIQLGMMPSVNVRHLFRGYAPSKETFTGSGMYQACSILGATVMPHSLFLGSGLVQPRLREYDMENNYYKIPEDEDPEEAYFAYRPTAKAIKYAMKYSIAELGITLFTFALFVNSAILIVAAASLYGTPEAADADLYAIHDLLSDTIAPVAGTLFMLALLFSGQSAGIVCTIAGQIVSEGHLRWTIKPWKRRIATRAIAIVPCLAISLAVGRSGLADALNASQVVLSILLPFLTAPLIYFTCKKSIMRVEVASEQQDEFEMSEIVQDDEDSEQEPQQTEKKYLDMSNNWATTIVAFVIWLFIAVLNTYMIIKLGIDGGI